MPILNMIAQGSGGGGGGSNVGEPTNLSASATSGTTVDIKWTDNSLQAIPPSTFQKSVLVRKVGSAPTTPSDGTTVVTETVMNTYQSSAYSDTGLTDGTTYYYQVFSYSTDGGITYGTPVSVTPQSGWQPGANTIAYYEFDGNLNDSVNSNNLSLLSGTVTYGTDSGGGKYAYFNQNTWSEHKILSPNIDVGAVTLMYWWQPKQVFSSGNPITIAYTLDDNSLIATTVRSVDFWGTTGFTATADTWYHLVITYEGGVRKFYVNGVYHAQENDSLSGTQTTKLTINNAWDTNGSSFANDNYISELIIEDKSWTAQEIADYYDQTKGNYGIS